MADSKLEVCKRLYNQYPGLSRPKMIELFMAKAGLTKAGATTYYGNMKSFDPSTATGSFIQNDEKAVKKETDDQIRKRLTTRFSVLKRLTNAICDGNARSLIVSGPPGLGKSFETELIIKDKAERSNFNKGFMRPAGLFKRLFQYRNPGDVVVFDDCDSVFADPVSLNLLKAACDSSEERNLTWGTGGGIKMEDEDGDELPNQFVFEGALVVITNVDFDLQIDNGRMSEHFQALMSRAHYVSMGMKNRRDYYIRIQMVLDEGMLLNRGISLAAQKEIMAFTYQHLNDFRELSVRTILKIADLYKEEPKDWPDFCESTMMADKL